MTVTEETEARRVSRSARLGSDRAALGQYFTPAPTAELLASMFELPEGPLVRILDPGAGVGSLSAALVDRIGRRHPGQRVMLTGVEVDPSLHDALSETLAGCAEEVPGSYRAVTADFARWGSAAIAANERFDLVVMNPPYKKITAGSAAARAFREAGVQTTNLYTGFMTLGLRLLAPGGQMVAITPRSFANGTYFRRFRTELLATSTVKRVHLFERRDEVFRDTDVLQENVVLAVKRDTDRGPVAISSSDGRGGAPDFHEVAYETVVQPDDPQQFIRIATHKRGLLITQEMAARPCTLDDLGLRVSTGRVVDFRVTEDLRAHHRPLTDAPLVYPGHLRDGGIRWPEGAARKPRALARTQRTTSLLMPAGHYVLVKRFSAKEEPKRVVASLVTPADLPGESWAFENHLNVIHDGGRGLDVELAQRLTDYLNSEAVDQFVRLFNGHTQINAGDLRSLRFPALTGSRSPVLV